MTPFAQSNPHLLRWLQETYPQSGMVSELWRALEERFPISQETRVQVLAANVSAIIPGAATRIEPQEQLTVTDQHGRVYADLRLGYHGDVLFVWTEV